MNTGEFLLLIESEMDRLNIVDESATMTPSQRRKVSAMGRKGWEIAINEDGYVIMTKNKQTMAVSDSGEVFVLNENDSLSDMTAIMESLYGDDDVVVESAIPSHFRTFESKNPILSVYTNGRGGVITIAKVQSSYSIHHINKKQIITEKSGLSADAVKTYLDGQQNFRKAKNRAEFLQIADIIGGVSAVKVSSESVTSFGLRMVLGLFSLRERLRQSILDRDDLINIIDSATRMRSGDIQVDLAEFNVTDESHRLLNALQSPTWWNSSAPIRLLTSAIDDFDG